MKSSESRWDTPWYLVDEAMLRLAAFREAFCAVSDMFGDDDDDDDDDDGRKQLSLLKAAAWVV